jgi:uncharacterized protein DUF4349
MKYLIPFICISLLFLSCNESGEPAAMRAIVNNVTETEMSEDSFRKSKSGVSLNRSDSETGKNKFNRKTIRKARSIYKVEDVKKATGQIYKMVDAMGGYVSKERLNKQQERVLETIERGDSVYQRIAYVIESEIEIRIPVGSFGNAFEELDKIAIEEELREIDLQDVTEQFYDLEKRIENKKEVEARYIQILRKRTGKISEVLEAEEKIAQIRGEIESMQGRFELMKNKIALSTIQLRIYQDPKEMIISKINLEVPDEITEVTFLDRLVDALAGGWNILVEIFIGLLRIWPVLLIFGLIGIAVRNKLKNKKPNKAKKEES